MTRTRLIRPVAIALTATLVLSACTSNGTTPGAAGQTERQLTPDEARLRRQADTFNQTMAEGALAGCALGTLVGVLVTKGNDRVKGGAAGCVVGGGLGAGAGAYIADKQEQYANTEERYNAIIADVHNDNERLAEVIDSAQRTIAADRAEIDQIDRDLAAKKISMDQARTQMRRVDDNTAYLQNTIKSLKARRDEYASAAQKSSSGVSKKQQAGMDAEIQRLDSQIARLNEQLETLVSRRKISSVG